MPRENERLYSGEQWAQIAKSLSLPHPSHYLKRALLEAAESYRWARFTDLSLSRKKQRGHIGAIAKLSRNLEVALRKLDYLSIKLLDSDLSVDDVALLADQADRVLANLPKQGAIPKKARLQFVSDLLPIFERVTAQSPTRRVKVDNIEYGPFTEFVEAALRPIDPHSTSGVATDIRTAIKKRSSTS